MMDYYVVGRANDDRYPLLEWDRGETAAPFSRSRAARLPVIVERPIRLRLGKPEPSTPQMVDYHSLPAPVVGETIKAVLEPLQIYGVQLVPAVVSTNQGPYDYWLLHVYNVISCVDRTRSVLSIDEEDGDILDIERLALDEKVLDEIPEDKRLVFVLAESTSTYLFHVSIRDAILAAQPKGLRFFKAEGWGSDAAFG